MFQQEYARIFLVISVTSLLASVAFYVYLTTHPGVAKDVVLNMRNLLPVNDSSSVSKTSSYYFSFFFVHNSLAALYALVLGLFPLVILPVMCAVVTSLTISAVLVAMKNPGLLFVTGILPHGVFELPALILSSTLGVYLSIIVVNKFILRKKAYSIIQAIHHTSRTFFFVVLPILFIAAALESMVTPLLIKTFYL
jgi:stage II sporulation protein M